MKALFPNQDSKNPVLTGRGLAVQSLANTLLLIVFLLILAAPLLAGQLFTGNFLVSQGRVAGLKTQKPISIYPNLSDFDSFVSFDLKFSKEGSFTDNLQLTSFQGQIANYQNLYTIFNNTQQTLTLSIRTTKARFNEPFQTLLITLRKPGQPASTTLAKKAPAFTTWLAVANTEVFSEDSDYVIAGDTYLKKIAQNQEGLVIMPVNFRFSQGSVVFPQSIFVKNQKLSLPATQEIQLPPLQKVSVDAIVKGPISSTQGPRRVGLPLLFKVSLAKQGQQSYKKGQNQNPHH